MGFPVTTVVTVFGMLTLMIMLSDGMQSPLMDHSYVVSIPGIDLPEDTTSLNRESVIAHPEGTSDVGESRECHHDHNQIASRTFEQRTQDRYLESFGLARRRVLGDGNCLFRAISQMLMGTEELHAELRDTAVNYIRDNLHMFRDFFHPDNPAVDFDQHMLHAIDQLSQNGVYAGQESVIALSLALGVNILITHGGTEADPRVFTLQHHSRDQSEITLHIVFSNLGGGHYDATVDRSDARDVIIEDETIKPSNRKFEWKETTFSSLFPLKHPSSPTVTSTSQVQVSCHESPAVTSTSSVQVSSHESKFRCPLCHKQLSSNTGLKRHTIKFHPEENVSIKRRTSFIKCMVPTCREEFRTVKNLLVHLEDFHSAIMEKTLLTFSSFDEFKSWKAEEELANNVFFGKERKETITPKSIYHQFVCNRNGCKRSAINTKGTNCRVRKSNVKGSCKVNGLCPSRMLVVIDKASGSVEVEYIQTHSHSVDFDQTKYLPIPQNVRDDIAKKLSLGISVDSILDDIHNDIGNLGGRDSDIIKFYQLVNRQNIVKMKRKLVDCKYQKHSDDATSTSLWVQEFRTNPSVNPVLVYKQQGVEDKSIPLDKNDFMLVLMTIAQADMYHKFGSRIVCMDSTHKTNYYEFKLVTLVVIDEYHKGYPVAFCISNREDTAALQFFLNAAKSKCPETDIGTILTDDDLAGVNAAKAVYGNDIQHYLCVWHVHQSWRRKLQSVQNKDNKVEIYYFLHALLNAKTESEYQGYLRCFTARYATLEPNFFAYFKNNYASRPEKWALHLRQSDLQTQINTNMFVESFHNKLKTIYFGRKQNKRIDKLIYILMNMEKDYYLNRIRYTTYNNPEDFHNSQSSERHASGLNIPDNFIVSVNENQYSVQSSNDNNSHYTVTRIATSCNLQSCFDKCHINPCVNLCIHMYTCSCPDYDLLCKHIHKVHSSNNLPRVSSESVEEMVHTSTHDTAAASKNVNVIKNKLEQPNIQSSLSLTSIALDLENVIRALTAADNSVAPQKMSPKSKVAANQNFEKQPRFQKTHGRRQKRTKVLHAPSAEDQAKLLQPTQIDNQQAPTGIRTGPSVAPYPPTSYVQRTTRAPQPSSTDSTTDDPIVVRNGGIAINNNYRIPPQTNNRPITFKLTSGKTVTVVTTRSPPTSKHSDNNY